MFARAIGDDNPVYRDEDAARAAETGGIVAPPTFIAAGAQFDPDYPLRPKPGQPWFGSGKHPSGVRRESPPAAAKASPESAPKKPSGAAAGGLHAEQHYTYHRHPRPGDVLTATTKPGRTWEKHGKRAGKLVFRESITEYRDQHGELVITARGVGVRTERVIAEK